MRRSMPLLTSRTLPDAIRPSDLSTGGQRRRCLGLGRRRRRWRNGRADRQCQRRQYQHRRHSRGRLGRRQRRWHHGAGGSSGGATGGASSSATGGAGATGGTTTATGGVTATCTPVPKSTGGLSCPGGLCTVGAYSGYDFTFGDKIASSVCMLPNSLCGAGTVGAQNPAGGYTVWGAGFGIQSLNTHHRHHRNAGSARGNRCDGHGHQPPHQRGLCACR